MARALLFLLVLACGCDASPFLVVDLRSDLSPGYEVSMARTRVLEDAGGELARVETRLSTSDVLVTGRRIAEVRDLQPGTHSVRVDLLDGRGYVVLGRSVRVRVATATAVTVLITRDCRDVLCPTGDPRATECVGGICVPPECTVEDSAACPGPRCADASACPSIVSCAEAACVAGHCLYRESADRCAAAERCDLVLRCS